MTDTPYDPRSAVAERGGRFVVLGFRCESCGHVVAVRRPRCPACRGSLVAHDLGPGGTVWSSTVIRFRIPHREPPYVLCYVDLDQGGRVLAHVPGSDEALTIDSRVRVVGVTPEGDVAVEELL